MHILSRDSRGSQVICGELVVCMLAASGGKLCSTGPRPALTALSVIQCTIVTSCSCLVCSAHQQFQLHSITYSYYMYVQSVYRLLVYMCGPTGGIVCVFAQCVVAPSIACIPRLTCVRSHVHTVLAALARLTLCCYSYEIIRYTYCIFL